MPKIHLTQASREEAFERECNDVFCLSLRTNYGRTGVYDRDIAASAGIGKATMTRLKKPEDVGRAGFGMIRKLAHLIRMSPDEWLRLGGYK